MRHILIGGAGIGGLTAALALARKGHRVTLMERRPDLATFGAGVQLAPNATRILARLDLLDKVRAEATEPASIRIRRSRDAADVVRLPVAAAARRLGAPFMLLHRADLQRLLADAATGCKGITFCLGSEVAGHAANRHGASVTLAADGQSREGDGYVDAAGVHASSGTGPGQPSARFTAWRALVSAEALPADYARPETTLWLGPEAHLVHYPLRGGSTINIVAITPRIPARDRSGDDLWSQTGDPAALRRHFGAWHGDATMLLDHAAPWRCWPLFEAGSRATWGQGASTRLGDAAHPMLPFLAQGASQAIEDADALAAALTGGGEVAAAFRHYEKRRAPRVARVQHASRRQGEIYHLGRPASDARDLVMRTLGGARALARMDWLYASP